MELINDCPECGKQLSRSRKYCACGWKIASFQGKKESDSNCQYRTPNGPCKEPGTVAPGRMEGKWFCREHWYLALKEKFKY